MLTRRRHLLTQALSRGRLLHFQLKGFFNCSNEKCSWLIVVVVVVVVIVVAVVVAVSVAAAVVAAAVVAAVVVAVVAVTAVVHCMSVLQPVRHDLSSLLHYE